MKKQDIRGRVFYDALTPIVTAGPKVVEPSIRMAQEKERVEKAEAKRLRRSQR